MEESVILVVEDEAFVRDLIRYILETAGYAVLTAADGEQALQVSRTFPTTIHLLVSDVLMPKLGGMELCEQILRERPALKVLLMSGTVVHQPREGVAFLRKPFRAEILRDHVRHLLPAAQPAWSRIPGNLLHHAKIGDSVEFSVGLICAVPTGKYGD